MDEVEKLLCIRCYEKSWDRPKFCGCFPYEAGLRVVHVILMLQFVSTIYLLILKSEDTYNLEKFT